MKTYPTIPRVDEAPEGIFDSGHLWLLEKIDGAQLRFQLRESGALRIGDRDRVYDDPEDIPEPYDHAVRHVRERLDRDALRDAVDDVESVVLFGEATHYHTIEYDWDRLPSFLGFDVWSGSGGSFRPPGAVQAIFERLGLAPVNAIERERHTRDFDPDSYTVPDSAWYDGPAAGVVARNKRGGRATLIHPEFQGETPSPDPGLTAETVVAERVSEPRLRALEAELTRRDGAVTFDTLYDRAVTDVLRTEHGRLRSIDRPELRSEIASRTRTFLDG